MIDHTGLSVADMAKSKAFYRAALAPLGYAVRASEGALHDARLRVFCWPRSCAGAAYRLLRATAAAGAQAWPDKPIRFIVPAPAGSSLDVLARIIGDKLKDTARAADRRR